MRTIDANSALNDLCGSQCGCRIDECGLDEPCEKARCILRHPTIEPEVRHGRWETWGYVFHGIEWKRCSCCGICADVSYYGLLDGEIKISTPAICGCCGARMDADHIADASKKVGGTDNG